MEFLIDGTTRYPIYPLVEPMITETYIRLHRDKTCARGTHVRTHVENSTFERGYGGGGGRGRGCVSARGDAGETSIRAKLRHDR